MPQVDSIDKIVQAYFTAVTNQPFKYKDVVHQPRPLRISAGILRGYTCPAHCGACCSRFSLDYLPREKQPNIELVRRWIDFDGRQVPIWSDMQVTGDQHCTQLDRDSGRCMIHGEHPFSCDFELIRFLHREPQDRPNIITAKLFGRGWNMLRVTGERGSMCTMTEPSKESIAEVRRKLLRLRAWCRHFGLNRNKVDGILAWTKGPSRNFGIVDNDGKVHYL